MVVGTVTVMILGASGMLGHDLQHVFPDSECSRVDINDAKRVEQAIRELSPQVVINAAAYTDVDGCEEHADQAFRVNGESLIQISLSCQEVGAKLIHFSTDYVFNGTREEYVESDTPDPINVYGRSKLLGEQNIRQHMEDYRIVRTSWLFGKHGKNFVDTMLALSDRMETVQVVNDQFGKPTYTADLAEKTKEIIGLEPGIYHITNEGICSWYEFASAIIPNTIPCSSHEFIRKAKRPAYSVLVNTKTGPMRHWKEALADYLRET
jgi:dTDP-4-dehydrorhamnose reductase